MTMTNHFMTGALVAVVFHRPEVALPVAFVSHFAIDALPHYGYGFIDPKERDKQNRFIFKQTIDAYTALALFWLVPYLLRAQQTPLVTGACMLVAFIPDAIWTFHFVRAGRGHDYPELNWFNKLHKAIQWCERRWGIYVEAVWVVLVVVAIKLVVS